MASATTCLHTKLPIWLLGRTSAAECCACGCHGCRSSGERLQELWPKLTSLDWMHSASAGLEHLLFPALVESNVTLTNAKGVYSHSLAEYALTCCNWFAKDLPRMRAAQKRGVWEPYEVEELRGVHQALSRTCLMVNESEARPLSHATSLGCFRMQKSATAHHVASVRCCWPHTSRPCLLSTLKAARRS